MFAGLLNRRDSVFGRVNCWARCGNSSDLFAAQPQFRVEAAYQPGELNVPHVISGERLRKDANLALIHLLEHRKTLLHSKWKNEHCRKHEVTFCALPVCVCTCRLLPYLA